MVSFRLCCNGQPAVSDYVFVPAVPCPNAAGVYDFSPCVVTGVYDIISSGSVLEYEWNAAGCYLKISN